MMQPAPGAAMPPQAPQMGAGGMSPPPAPMQPPLQVPPGVVTIDAVMRLLRDNAHRRFRIDIEADSTIAGDESQEKRDRSELIAAITKLVETWGPIVAASPFMAKLAGELMLFGVRGFRVGRSLETVIEETVEKFEEAAGMPKQPPEPSPDELIKAKTAQAKGQAEIMKAQIEAQTAQMEARAKAAEVQMQAQAAAQAHGHAVVQGHQEAALNDQAARNDAASQMMKAQIEEMRFRRAVEAENAPDKPTKG